MNILINAGWVLAAFFTMEFVAWFTHKYVMHGLLWTLHRDHHVKNKHSFFERNDFFFLLFATPGIILILTGVLTSINDPKVWIGAGISFYGMAYFFVHDLFIHQRLKVFRRTNNIYLRAIRKAHKMHHKHLGPEDGECFGMLLVPLKYFREARKSKDLMEY